MTASWLATLVSPPSLSLMLLSSCTRCVRCNVLPALCCSTVLQVLRACIPPPKQGNKEAPPPPHVVSQIKDAASNWGFFQLINSGISQQLLDQHYEATKE